MNILLRTIGILIYRDLLAVWRQRGRMVGLLVAPILITVVISAGLRNRLGEGYFSSLLAGMVFQTMIYAIGVSAGSMIWDREFGFLRVLTLAPLSRVHLALGKVMGAAVQALIHALIFPFAAMLGEIYLTPFQIIEAWGLTFLLAVGMSGLGMVVASYARSIEELNALLQLVFMPMLFFSGTYFAIRDLPPTFQKIACLNPASYGIDALKHIFVPIHIVGVFTPEFPFSTDLIVITIYAVLMTILSVRLFRLQEEGR